jgi:hypothetical protein
MQPPSQALQAPSATTLAILPSAQESRAGLHVTGPCCAYRSSIKAGAAPSGYRAYTPLTSPLSHCQIEMPAVLLHRLLREYAVSMKIGAGLAFAATLAVGVSGCGASGESGQFGYAKGIVRLCQPEGHCRPHDARVVYLNSERHVAATDMQTQHASFGRYTLIPGRYTAIATAGKLAGRTGFVVRAGHTTRVSVTFGKTVPAKR